MAALRELQTVALDYILLLFLRVAGIVWSNPIYGRRSIPGPARIAFALALTYFFFTSVPVTVQPEYNTLLTYALLCVKEILIGAVIGFVLTLFFSISHSAGQMIDMQIGLGMANVYDPQTNAQVPLMGNLLNVVMILVFFAVGGDRKLISILYLTIVKIPVGGVTLTADTALAFVEMFTDMFILAVRMALPIIAAGVMTEAIMGMIIHTVPQMNVFVVGMPLKVAMGFVVLLLILPVYAELSTVIFDEMYVRLSELLATMAGV